MHGIEKARNNKLSTIKYSNKLEVEWILLFANIPCNRWVFYPWLLCDVETLLS